MKRILITGGAGFISSHLIEKIVDNYEIVVYDNMIRNSIEYTRLLDHKNLKLVAGDVLDANQLNNAVKGVDILIHAAAIAGIYSVGNNATNTMRVNFIGSYNALEAAVKNGVKRFIDFSTSEVYGPYVYKGKETDATTLGAVGEKRWVYAVSKLAAEHLAHTYNEKYGLEVITVRPFNVYGPRQIGEGAVQQMIKRALKNEPITIYNQGTQIRSWCYVKDFVDGLEKTIILPEAAGHIFNIGNPLGTVTNIELALKIKYLTSSNSVFEFKKHPGPEVEIRVPDIENAERILNFAPQISLEEGIKNTINWYKEHLLDS